MCSGATAPFCSYHRVPKLCHVGTAWASAAPHPPPWAALGPPSSGEHSLPLKASLACAGSSAAGLLYGHALLPLNGRKRRCVGARPVLQAQRGRGSMPPMLPVPRYLALLHEAPAVPSLAPALSGCLCLAASTSVAVGQSTGPGLCCGWLSAHLAVWSSWCSLAFPLPHTVMGNGSLSSTYGAPLS